MGGDTPHFVFVPTCHDLYQTTQFSTYSLYIILYICLLLYNIEYEMKLCVYIYIVGSISKIYSVDEQMEPYLHCSMQFVCVFFCIRCERELYKIIRISNAHIFSQVTSVIELIRLVHHLL